MKQLTEQNFKPLPISLEHGRLGGLLPGPHRDPFDRILAAQALLADHNDPAIAGFGVKVLWWRAARSHATPQGSGTVRVGDGQPVSRPRPASGHRCTLDPTYVFIASSPPP
jgi:hypothetical protein